MWRCYCIWVESTCHSGSLYLRYKIDLGEGSIKISIYCALSIVLKMLTGFDRVSIYFVTAYRWHFFGWVFLSWVAFFSVFFFSARVRGIATGGRGEGAAEGHCPSTSISELNNVQQFQFQISKILVFTSIQKLFGPEISLFLPCLLPLLDNSQEHFIFFLSTYWI